MAVALHPSFIVDLRPKLFSVYFCARPASLQKIHYARYNEELIISPRNPIVPLLLLLFVPLSLTVQIACGR